jgi:hypothetical protein
MTVLALATLGNATKIKMILSLLQHSRWPRQVHTCVTVAGVITLNSANGITALITIWDMLKLCEDTLNVTSAEFLDLGKEL